MPVPEIKPARREGAQLGFSTDSDQVQEGGDRGERGQNESLPRGLHPPHAEVQHQARVSGHIQDVVWRQPDLGLDIEEGKKIEAGWSDAWTGEK